MADQSFHPNSRQALLRIFLVPSLVVVPLVFYYFLTVENRTFFVIPTPSFEVNGVPVSFGTLPLSVVEWLLLDDPSSLSKATGMTLK